jgi:hypothetical protein
MPERRAYARTGRLYMSSHRPFGRDSQFSRSYGYDKPCLAHLRGSGSSSRSSPL